LRAFENRTLRRIFEPKREEIIGGWRKVHNEELHNLYFSTNTMRITWAVYVARMAKKKNALFIRKTRRKVTTRKTQTYM
jgi:hypothetical protein